MFQNAYTMLAMSMERYIAIMHPFLRRLGKRGCLQVVALCWLLAFLTPIPTAVTARLHEHLDSGYPLPANQSANATVGLAALGANSTDLIVSPDQGQGIGAAGGAGHSEDGGDVSPGYSEYANASSETYWLCYESWATERQRISYTVTIMVLQYFLPLGVLVFTYARIVHVIWLKDLQQAAPGQLLAPPGQGQGQGQGQDKDNFQTMTYVPNAKEKSSEKEPDPRKKVE